MSAAVIPFPDAEQRAARRREARVQALIDRIEVELDGKLPLSNLGALVKRKLERSAAAKDSQ